MSHTQTPDLIREETAALSREIERLRAENDRLRAERDVYWETLDSIRVFSSDTLSGPVSEQGDARWYRTAVREVLRRAAVALARHQEDK